MHPAVPLVAAFGGLWWIGDSQRRQAAEYRSQARPRVVPAARDGRG